MNIRTVASAFAIAALISTGAAGVHTDLAAASAGKTGGCTPTWKVVATPPAADTWGVSVDAFSGRDVMFTGVAIFTSERPVWHWDGTAVNEAAAQIPVGPFFHYAGGHDTPYGASFSSDSDGWVLLGKETSTLPVAERWHGGRWTRVPFAASPDARHIATGILGIASVSAADAWAFGGHLQGVGSVIEHWDGTQWSIVPHPMDAVASSAYMAAVVSPTDIWAAGTMRKDGVAAVPFFEHWDGTRWSLVSSPTIDAFTVESGISASGPNDVWLAASQLGPDGTWSPLVQHWDGTAWSVVTNLPDLGSNTQVGAIYASGPNDVWTVAGTVGVPGGGGFLHWDGAAWTTVPFPTPPKYGAAYGIRDLDGTGPNDVWAIGTATDDSAGAGGFSYDTGQILHLSCGKD